MIALCDKDPAHFDALALVLSLEHDLLDRPDPFISALRRFRRKRIVSFRSTQLEAVFINGITARSVLKRDIAFGKVWILEVSEISPGARLSTYSGGFMPAQDVILEHSPVLCSQLCPRRFFA